MVAQSVTELSFFVCWAANKTRADFGAFAEASMAS
jgi:hypothetical protein